MRTRKIVTSKPGIKTLYSNGERTNPETGFACDATSLLKIDGGKPIIYMHASMQGRPYVIVFGREVAFRDGGGIRINEFDVAVLDRPARRRVFRKLQQELQQASRRALPPIYFW